MNNLTRGFIAAMREDAYLTAVDHDLDIGDIPLSDSDQNALNAILMQIVKDYGLDDSETVGGDLYMSMVYGCADTEIIDYRDYSVECHFSADRWLYLHLTYKGEYVLIECEALTND